MRYVPVFTDLQCMLLYEAPLCFIQVITDLLCMLLSVGPLCDVYTDITVQVYSTIVIYTAQIL